MSHETHFLLDEPESTDAFGPHSQIADLLYGDITRSAQGHAVGLIGDWGSGKSTVISLLEKLLKSGASKLPVTLFKYDAWAHQGDSLRRSFLDDLITFFKSNGLLTTEEANIQTSRIWDRTEETTTTTEPLLRPHVTWLIVSGLLIPLGSAIESFVKPDENHAYRGGALWLHLIAVALMLFPLILFIAFAAFNKWGSINIKKHLFGATTDLRNFKITSIFVEKTSGKRESKTIRTAQDSVIEFRLVFDKIIETIMRKSPEWRFVIVIDNIDRLPVTQARFFWGTMTTFFDRVSGTSGAAKRYWLLVPFSRPILTKVFQDADVNSQSDVAKGFIDKTFDMILRVPPPVIASWREYLFTHLQKAFPKHSTEEVREVRNIFDLFGSAPDRALTPRELKLFVNDLVALYRQRGEDIELAVLAAFHLRRELLGSNGANILNGKVLNEREVSLLKGEGRPDWQSLFAALYFDVSVEQGLHILLQEPVRNALAQGDEKALRNMEETAGFVDVLATISRSILAEWKSGIPMLIRLASCVGSLKCASSKELATLWRDLRKAFSVAEPWDASANAPAAAFKAVLANSPVESRPEVSRSIRTLVMKATVPELPISGETNSVVNNWFQAANAGYEFANELPAIRVPGGPLFNIAILQELVVAKLKGSPVDKFEPGAPPDQMFSALAAEIAAGRCLERGVEFVSYTREAKLSADWNKVRDACFARLKTESINILECQNLLYLLIGIFNHVDQKIVQPGLSELAVTGYLFHWFQASKKQPNTAAIAVLAIILVDPAGTKSADFGQSPAGHTAFAQFVGNVSTMPAVAEALMHLIQATDSRARIFLLGLQHANLRPLIGQMMAAVMNETIELNIEAATLIDQQAYLEEMASHFDVATLLNSRLSKRAELLAEISSRGFALAKVPLYGWLAPKDIADGNSAFLDFLSAGIENVAQQNWKAIIQAPQGREAKVIPLFDLIAGAKPGSRLGLNVEQAIAEWMRDTRIGTVSTSSESQQQILALYERMGLQQRENLVQNVLDDLEAANMAMPIRQVIAVVGALLTATAFAKNDVSTRVRRILFPLLEAPDAVGIGWIGQLAASGGLLNHVIPEVKTGFQDQLDAAFGMGLSEEIITMLAEIRAASGLQPPEQSASPPAASEPSLIST